MNGGKFPEYSEIDFMRAGRNLAGVLAYEFSEHHGVQFPRPMHLLSNLIIVSYHLEGEPVVAATPEGTITIKLLARSSDPDSLEPVAEWYMDRTDVRRAGALRNTPDDAPEKLLRKKSRDLNMSELISNALALAPAQDSPFSCPFVTEILFERKKVRL